MSNFYNIKNNKSTPVAKDGVIIVPNPNTLNFTGSGVSVSGDINGNANVDITGGGGGSTTIASPNSTINVSTSGSKTNLDVNFSATSSILNNFSFNPNNWNLNTLPTSQFFTDISFLNNILLVIGTGGVIFTSPDGVSWTSRTSGTTQSLYGSAYGNNLFVIAGDNGTIITSPDAITWTSRTSGTTQPFSGLCFGNNLFVAVGTGGVIFTSPDGITWTSRTSGTTQGLFYVSYKNNTFFAVGSNGTILTSTDGITWTSRTSGTTQTLSSFTYGNGTFIATGNSGTVLTSTDGINWTSRTSGTTQSLNGITFGNNIFIACGSTGGIFTSPDGITWTSRTSGTTNILASIDFSRNTFTSVGFSGTTISNSIVFLGLDVKIGQGLDKNNGTIIIPTQGNITAGSYTNANISVNALGLVTEVSNGTGGGAVYYDSVGKANVVVNNTNVTTIGSFIGTNTTLFMTGAPGGSADFQTYFNSLPAGTIWNFSGDTFEFVVESYTDIDGTSFNLTLPAGTSFPNLINPSTPIQNNKVNIYTQINDIALGDNLNGVVSNNQAGRPTLSITASGGSASFDLPLDVVTWTNASQVTYVSDKTIPPVSNLTITSPASSLSSGVWEFNVNSITGFTDQAEIVLVDNSGKTISGVYRVGINPTTNATLEQVNYDRKSGFVLNNSYPNMTARQGLLASATLYINSSLSGSKVSRLDFDGDTLLTTTTLQSDHIIVGVDKAKELVRIDDEIALKIGSDAPFNSGTQISTSGTGVLFPPNQLDVTKPNALATWQLITGSTATTLPTASLPPLPQYSYLAKSTNGSQGTYTTPAQYNTVQVPLSGAALYFNFTTSPSWATGFIPSNEIYYGSSSIGSTPIFTFQPSPLTAIDKEIALKSVASLNTLKGDINILQGPGIGVSTSGPNITINNTGSGTPGAGNTVDFTNNQFAETGITEAGTESIYIQMGYTSATEIGSGGTLNGTTYWDTSNAVATGSGLGIRAKVATTWTSVSPVLYTPAYTVVFTTPAGASANHYLLDNLLFAKKTYTGNVWDNANLWPPLRDSNPSDDIQLIPVKRPSFSVASSGTNQWTATIGEGIWRASFGNYTWNVADLNTEYVAYLRIHEDTGVSQPPTFVSLTRNSGLGGIQILSSLPGTSGSTPTLQQVVNIGNTITDTSGNVGAIILTDNTSNKSTTLDGTKIKGQKLVLDGSGASAGSVSISPNQNSVSYSLSLPAGTGTNGNGLITDGTGNLSWGNAFQQIAAVSTINVVPNDGQIVDGYTPATNDRILLIGQTDATENGLWLANVPGAWVKLVSFQNQSVFAVNGTSNIGKTYNKKTISGNEVWVQVSSNTLEANPPVWLTGDGDPADSLGMTGNYYQDISRTVPGNKIWLKTQSITSPFWVRQPNLENAISSYNQQNLNFSFARVVATTAITLSGTQTIDGVALAVGDIVLVSAQTLSQDNGLYTVASGTWSRVSTTPIVQGLVVIISLGTANIGNSFIQTLPISSVGTSPQSWTIFAQNGASTVLATFLASNDLSRRIPKANSTMRFNSDGVSPAIFSVAQTGNPDFSIVQGVSGITLSSSTATPVVTVGSNVNNVAITSAVAAGSPTISATGTDTNINLTLTGKATGSVVLGNATTNTGLAVLGSATTRTILSAVGLNTNTDLSLQPKGTGILNLVDNFTNYTTVTGVTTTNSPTISAAGADTNISLALRGKGTSGISLGTNQANFVSINGGATGVTPTILSTGSDSSINLNLSGKGNASVLAFNAFLASYLTLAGGTTGNPSIIQVAGSDTNSALTLAGKGTGAINLTTGSQVNIGNGTRNLILAGNGTGPASIQTQATNQGIAIAPNGQGFTIVGNTSTQTGVTVAGNSTTQTIITATGAGTNLDLALQTKGAGNTIIGNTTNQTGVTISGNQTSNTNLTATGSASVIDFVVSPKGGGWFYPLGSTLSSTASQQPKIAFATQRGATTLGAGTVGQVLSSNGTTGAPHWDTRGGTWAGTVASGTTFSNTNTLLSGTSFTNDLPSYVSYSNGTITNNSTAAITVIVSFTISLSATTAPTEVDFWIAASAGGVRFAQVEYPSTAWAGSGSNFALLRSVSTPVRLASGGTVGCYAWASSNVTTASLFGGFLTTTTFTVI